MLSLEVSQLAGLFAEAVLYGIYLISLAFCLLKFPSTTFLTRQSPGEKVLIGITLIIAVMVTLNISLNMFRMVAILSSSIAATQSIPSSGGDLVNVYQQAAETGNRWQDPFRAVCIYVESMLADGVLIWRCWVVYNKSYFVIIVPVIFWLASIGVSAWSIFAGVNIGTAGKELVPTVISYWALTFTLNIILPVLMVYRLQRHERELAGVFSGKSVKSSLNRIKRIIIDSGLLYAVTTVPTLVTEIVQDTALHITSGMDIMVVGIAFNLILIRVGSLRKEEHSVTRNSVLTSIQFASAANLGNSFNISSEATVGLEFAKGTQVKRKEWEGSLTTSLHDKKG